MAPSNARNAWLSILLFAAGAATSWAQVSESPVKDLTPHGVRRPPPVPQDLATPNADPHDLNGVYLTTGGGPGGGRGVGPAPPADRGAGGQAPPPPTRPRTNDPFAECTPTFTAGSPGNPGMIVQTPGRLTFIGEGNNNVRHIYLDQKFPEHLVRTRLGLSIGHWDGDTVVIETRGLRTNALSPAMSSITSVIERLHKVDGGRTIEFTAVIEGIDVAGKTVTESRSGTMSWRPDQVPIEVVCEDVQNYSFP